MRVKFLLFALDPLNVMTKTLERQALGCEMKQDVFHVLYYSVLPNAIYYIFL